MLYLFIISSFFSFFQNQEILGVFSVQKIEIIKGSLNVNEYDELKNRYQQVSFEFRADGKFIYHQKGVKSTNGIYSIYKKILKIEYPDLKKKYEAKTSGMELEIVSDTSLTLIENLDVDLIIKITLIQEK